MYTIFDLDNCISDDGWRFGYLSDESLSRRYRFANYHSRCIYDELNLEGIQKLPENILIFTGRPSKYYNETATWLARNGMMNSIKAIFMRPIGNRMSSPELKEHLLLNSYPIASIKMAYDDRQDVLDMYKKHGIPTTLKRINKNGM